MPADGMIGRAVEDVADGNSVDWDLLDSQALDEDERTQLKYLRILEGIANLHRSTQDPLDSAAEPTLADTATTVEPPATPARTWGRYYLQEKVGEGSFGSVYRAWDPELERELAIKILHGHLTDERVRDRLLREGRALARVRQTNVVSVLAVESNESRVGLCMEFVHGQTLEDVLRTHGTLSARETVLVGEDVCRALAAVHNAGFVHRDVKARNVMREQAGRIVLMDFGTGREARALEDAHRPDVAGTPLYMAPEVLAGGPATTRSDVYSVGVLLYHLVTSDYPVNARSIEELRAAHRQGHRRLLSESRPDLPTAFTRVVERALSTEPKERYANAGALLNALGGALANPDKATITVPRWLFSAAKLAVMAVSIPLVLGMITSFAFNVTLDRAAFSTETVLDWWTWGLRSIVLPLAFLVMGCVAVALSSVMRRMARAVSSLAVRLDEGIQWRLRVWAHRLSLDHPQTLASGVLVLSSVALGFAIWYFWPLIDALVSVTISTRALERIRPLAADLRPNHVWYRQAFSGLVVLMVAAWYFVFKFSARRRQPLSRGLLVGGLAVVGLTILAQAMSYRLLVKNKFEATTWKGQACYIIGERRDDFLLFCDGLEPPRNRVVPKTDADLQRHGRFENLFTNLSSVAPQGTPAQKSVH
jgi:hypothetical protein